MFWYPPVIGWYPPSAGVESSSFWRSLGLLRRELCLHTVLLVNFHLAWTFAACREEFGTRKVRNYLNPKIVSVVSFKILAAYLSFLSLISLFRFSIFLSFALEVVVLFRLELLHFGWRKWLYVSFVTLLLVFKFGGPQKRAQVLQRKSKQQGH
jgi:hypothetical protein